MCQHTHLSVLASSLDTTTVNTYTEYGEIDLLFTYMYLPLSVTAAMDISGFVCHLLGDGCPFISLTFVSVSIPEDWTWDISDVTQLNISFRWLAHTQINYPTGWYWKQVPDSKRLQKRVSPMQKWIWGCRQSCLPEAGINRWAVFLQCRTEIVSLYYHWPQNRKATLL